MSNAELVKRLTKQRYDFIEGSTFWCLMDDAIAFIEAQDDVRDRALDEAVQKVLDFKAMANNTISAALLLSLSEHIRALKSKPAAPVVVCSCEECHPEFHYGPGEEVAQPISTEFDGWQYTDAEKQSKSGRIKWAEGLILQLPETHDGRNSWLMNYGVGEVAQRLRGKRGIVFDHATRAAETIPPTITTQPAQEAPQSLVAPERPMTPNEYQDFWNGKNPTQPAQAPAADVPFGEPRLVPMWRKAMLPRSATMSIDGTDMERTLDIVEHYIKRELDRRQGAK